MSRTFRLALAACALASVGLPALASAEPPPPRPVCQLHFRDQTISNNIGLPDVTYPQPYWIC
ncbi:MAG: hypothetical protein QOE45_3430 [Frankiaceae bacterium]|nr:hypothetical protein [Frankiaceae bacterium]